MVRIEYIIDDDFLDDETKMSAKSQGYLWELIRCKDCKHYDIYKNGVNGFCRFYNVPKTVDGYCDEARRRK